MKNKKNEKLVNTYLKRTQSPGDTRFVFNGVFVDKEGQRVSTDGRVMTIGETDFLEGHEEKIVNLDSMTYIEGKFPEWRNVLPKDLEEHKFYFSDFSEVTGLSKVKGLSAYEISDGIRVSKNYIDLFEGRKLIIGILDEASPIIVRDLVDNSFFFVVMPMKWKKEENEFLDVRGLTKISQADDEDCDTMKEVFHRITKTERPKKELEPVDKVEIPTWAICYIANGDDSGISDEDIKEINDFLGRYKSPTFEYGEEEYFSNDPAFGLPTNVVEVKVYELSA